MGVGFHYEIFEPSIYKASRAVKSPNITKITNIIRWGLFSLHSKPLLIFKEASARKKELWPEVGFFSFFQGWK